MGAEEIRGDIAAYNVAQGDLLLPGCG